MFHSADEFISFLYFSAFVVSWLSSSGLFVNISAVLVLYECIFQSRAHEPQTRSPSSTTSLLAQRNEFDKLDYKRCHPDAQRKRDWMTVGHEQMDGCSCSTQPCSCTLTSGFWARPGPTWRLCSLNVWFPEAGRRRGPLNPLPVSQQSFQKSLRKP